MTIRRTGELVLALLLIGSLQGCACGPRYLGSPQLAAEATDSSPGRQIECRFDGGMKSGAGGAAM